MSDLAEKANALRWHHSIDLGGGVVTKGVKSLRALEHEYQAIFDPVKIDGASLLDIGAWNGAHSFEAARRGARVLATDSYVWTHPVWRGREGFDMANAALGLNVEARQMEISEISVDRLGQFDVVLFLGVLYHLPSPLPALQQVASVATECLVIETHCGMMWYPRPLLRYYPGDSLAGDPTNFFVPNKAFVIEALRECGFTRFDSLYSGRRLIVRAWRSNRLRRLGDAPEQHIVNHHLLQRLVDRYARLTKK